MHRQFVEELVRLETLGRYERGHWVKASDGYERAAEQRGYGRAAERRVKLALFLLPPGDRERYKHEWMAEMATISAGEAAKFAAYLLVSAPRISFSLIRKKLWRRRTI